MKPLSHWVFLSAPAAVGAAILLGFTIRSLLRTLRSSVVASLPLAAAQPVTFAAAGSYDLYAEGGSASARFGGLDFGIADADGRDVPMHRVVFRTVVSSFTRVRVQLRSFEIPHAGTYTLRVPGGDDRPGDVQLLLGRPVRVRVIGHILALVALGIATIGSSVATALLIVQPPMQP